MIYRRTWIRQGRCWPEPGGRHRFFTDAYTGWFLLGIIPLYVRRDRHLL